MRGLQTKLRRSPALNNTAQRKSMIAFVHEPSNDGIVIFDEDMREYCAPRRENRHYLSTLVEMMSEPDTKARFEFEILEPKVKSIIGQSCEQPTLIRITKITPVR